MAYLCFASQQALLKIRGDAVRINNKPFGAYVWAMGGSSNMQHVLTSMPELWECEYFNLGLREEFKGLIKLAKSCHVHV